MVYHLEEFKGDFNGGRKVRPCRQSSAIWVRWRFNLLYKQFLMRIVICTLIPLFHNVRMRWTAEAEDMREAMSEVAVLGKTRQGHWIQRSGGRETAMDWWASNGLMTNGRALNNYFSRKHKSEWVMFLNIFTSENNAACEMKRIH